MSEFRFGPDHHATYIPHAFAEQTIDTGEAVINYAMAGAADKPALLLIPGQTESWWGYEQAMAMLQSSSRSSPLTCAGKAGRAGPRDVTPSITSAMIWCVSLRLSSSGRCSSAGFRREG